MKTRKQKKPVSKRASHRPTKRSAASRRPAAARGKAAKRAKASVRGGTLTEESLTLAAECTVAVADSLKAELVRRLDESGPVIVDVSALQRIDTAALQLLAAFVRDRRTAGRAVEWHGRAAALDSAAGLLGLNAMLELPGEVGR